MKKSKINFVPVDGTNRDIAVYLKIKETQNGLCESAFDCLAEADELALWRPVLIYLDDIAVGFAMYGAWENEGTSGRVWLDRFFIDENFQGLGYSKTLLPPLMVHIKNEYSCDKLYLSVFNNNPQAISIYEKLGFVFSGEFDFGGEKMMVKYFGKSPVIVPLTNNYPWIDKFAVAMPSAITDYKIEWEWDRFLIEDKMYGAICTPNKSYPAFADRTLLTLKCDPTLIPLLIEQYEYISQAFYMDKKNWISIFLDGDTPVDLIKDLVVKSYKLVFEKLTKKVQYKIMVETATSPFWTMKQK